MKNATEKKCPKKVQTFHNPNKSVESTDEVEHDGKKDLKKMTVKPMTEKFNLNKTLAMVILEMHC